MAEMSKAEFERMQNDAIRRVRNMQQKAQSHVPPMPNYVRPLRGIRQPGSEDAASENTADNTAKSQSQPAVRHADSQNKGMGLGFLDKLNLKSFEIDGDRALILMMMALLGKETADETLMLALLYIML